MSDKVDQLQADIEAGVAALVGGAPQVAGCSALLCLRGFVPPRPA